MSAIIFQNVRVLDPANNLDAVTNLRVADGVIAEIGALTAHDNEQIIDGKGCALIPGLIDMQVWTGEPGFEHKETLASASLAAARGGVTTMIVMPNTQPVIDDAALVDFISRRARDTAVTRVIPMAAITKGCNSDQLTEFALLREAGAIAFTNGDHSIMNALTMRHAMSYASNFDALVVHHAMDENLFSVGVMNEGELSTRLGLSGIPAAAETVMIDRDLRLVALTGARYHLAQVSSEMSLPAIAEARRNGHRVSCGVSANHLLLNENDVENYRSFAKLNPPLRGESDRLALVNALSLGLIDVVVSAHNPQDADAKRQPFNQAAFGSIGVETLLTSLISLHHAEGIDLLTVLRTVTQRPAEILGLETGTLSIGAPADITLVDLGAPWVISAHDLASKSKNAALDDRRVQGRVEACFVAGKPVFTRAAKA